MNSERRMKLPQVSIAFAMVCVTLAGVDLAAFRYIYSPTNGDSSHYLVMSVVPMVNVTAILGFHLISLRRLRDQPFLLGFLLVGLAAMLGHIACHQIYPDAMFDLYSVPFGSFQKFCNDHLPWNHAIRPDGTGYWRYYALLSLCYCWPQFLLAGLGGAIAKVTLPRKATGHLELVR
jgi:hypothetical protein